MAEERYHWRKSATDSETTELIDRVSGKPIAVITSVARKWQWSRRTTWLLHGAPSTEGKSDTLDQAKTEILAGLPKNM